MRSIQTDKNLILPDHIDALKKTNPNFLTLKSQNILFIQSIFKEILDFLDHLKNGWRALSEYQAAQRQRQPVYPSLPAKNNSNNHSQSNIQDAPSNKPVYSTGNIHTIHQPSNIAQDNQLMDVDYEFDPEKLGPDRW